jgi:hypothetical protein
VDLLPGKTIEESDMDKFRTTIDINIMAAVLVSRAPAYPLDIFFSADISAHNKHSF